MKPEYNHMEDLFRSAFENASLDTPHKEKMWAHIQEAIQKPPVAIWRTVRFRVSSIAASIALLLGFLYYSNQNQEAIVSKTATETSNHLAPQDDKNIQGSSTTKDSSIPNHTEEKEQITSKSQNNALIDRTNDIPKNNKKNVVILKENNHKVIDNGSQYLLEKEETYENEEELNALLENIENPTPKEEGFNTKTIIEIREVISLANPTILIPFSLERQPQLQLVAIQQIDEKKAEKSNMQWWLGFSGGYNQYNTNFNVTSPDLPSPLISAVNSTFQNFSDCTNVGKAIRDDIKLSPSLAINIELGRFISKHWFVKSGIGFNTFRYKIDLDVKELLILSLGGTKTYKNVINSSTSQLYIPLQIGYQSDNQTLNWFASTGFTTDILLNNSLTGTYSSATYDFGRYKTLNFSTITNLGLMYQLSPQFGTFLELNYRRTLGSVYDSPHLQSRPHWLGLGFGARFKF